MQRLQIFLSSLLLTVTASATAAEQLVPLLVPQLVKVVEQKQCVQEGEQVFCADIRLTVETTGVSWLDQALLARLDLTATESAQVSADVQAHLQWSQQQAAAWLAENYAEIKAVRSSDDPYTVGFEHSDSIRFIAQRNHLASFKQFTYGYSGGAHGMYSTRYAVFDLNTRQQLRLTDILQDSAEDRLLEALRQRYTESYAEYAQNWLSDKPAEQAKSLLTDNFIFNEQGLTFSYPPYELAPYSEGEVRLTLDYSVLQDILQPEYVLDN